MGFVETRLLLPTHWAPYLVNGDRDQMTDDEEALCTHIEHLFGHCTGVSETSEFAHHHDATADGILSADCSTFTFLMHQPE